MSATKKGRAYLEERGLHAALELGLVRYATESHPNPRVKGMARYGRRVAMLLSDVSGNPAGIQFRQVRQTPKDESKILSLKNSRTRGVFFGHPELIEASQLVCVAEGMADTL